MKYKKNPETYQLRNSEECVLQPFFFSFQKLQFSWLIFSHCKHEKTLHLNMNFLNRIEVDFTFTPVVKMPSTG